MKVNLGQSQFTPPLLVDAPISMGTGQLVGIVALSIITLGLAAGVNRLVQNYRFRAAIMKGGEREIEVAKSALRWGASNWLYNSDLITLGKNNQQAGLTFLFAQQSYDNQVYQFMNVVDYGRINPNIDPFETAWTGYKHRYVHFYDNAANSFINLFQAFQKASVEQLACTILLQSYLTIRPLKNCNTNYTKEVIGLTSGGQVVARDYIYRGDWLAQAPLRIFSDALKSKDYQIIKLFFDNGLEVQNCIFPEETETLPDADKVKGHIVFRDLSIASLKFWLDNGLDPNTSGGANNNTLLTACVKKGEAASVRFLLERGATNIDVQNSSGETALMAAVNSGNVDIAGILLENKANPNLGNPLQIAALHKDESMCRLLIEKKAKFTQTTRDTTLAQTGDADWDERLWGVYSGSSHYLDAFFKS